MNQKKHIIGILILIAVLIAVLRSILGGTAGTPGELRHAAAGNNSSILIVYYSYSGTTRRVAEKLQEMTLYMACLLENVKKNMSKLVDSAYCTKER